MEILNREEFERRMPEMLDGIRKGKVFVYPTDTIYGIGCGATNTGAVERIRVIKKRAEKPFSVIAPSVRWIIQNCHVGHTEAKWLRKLPGPYTLILGLSNRAAISPAVNGNTDSVGVRIPASWFSGVVANADIPFVTTSVNRSGEPHMTSLEDIDQSIRESVDYIVYDGPLKNSPSKVVDLASGTDIIRG